LEFQYAEHSTVVRFGDLVSGTLFLLPKEAGFLVCLAAEISNGEDDEPTEVTVALGTIDTSYVGAVPSYFDRHERRAPFVIKLDSVRISPSSAGEPNWPRPADEAQNGALIIDRDASAWLVVRQANPLFIRVTTGEAVYRSPQPAMIFNQWSITVPDGKGRRIVVAKPTYNLDSV